MFKILDGRDKFYQWDKNRKLLVEDSSINEVHFCNRYGNCSIIRATYQLEGKTLVDVPNVILQDSFKLHVYAFDTEYTKHEDVFEIVARTKPEDYVNTEEDVKLWDELAQKLIDLESKIDTEGIQEAVTKYLTDNPPEAGATREEAAQIAQNKEDIATLRQEFDNFEIPEVDLTDYATKKYVDDAIDAIDIPTGDSGEVDLTDYAKKDYVDEAIQNIEHPTVDLSDYATKEYVDGASAQTFYLDLTNFKVDKNVQDISDKYIITCADAIAAGAKINVYVKSYNDSTGKKAADLSYFPVIVEVVSNTEFKLRRAGFTVEELNYTGGIDDYIYTFVKDYGTWQVTRTYNTRIHNVTAQNQKNTLTEFATKELVDTKIADALNAIGVAEEGTY